MSVLACDRKGCKDIMCDRFSYEFGYICSDCFEELCNNNQISIKEFMESEKDFEENQMVFTRFEKIDNIFPIVNL